MDTSEELRWDGDDDEIEMQPYIVLLIASVKSSYVLAYSTLILGKQCREDSNNFVDSAICLLNDKTIATLFISRRCLESSTSGFT